MCDHTRVLTRPDPHLGLRLLCCELQPHPLIASVGLLQNMKDVFANKIPIWQQQQKEIKTMYGDKILGTCTVEQAYGGMRSVKSMVYETSLLDPVEVSSLCLQV